MLMIYAVICLLVVGGLSQQNGFNLFKFQQNDYEIVPEIGEIDHYDKRYVKYASAVNFKYNRTSPAMNITFEPNVDLENDLEVVIQAYKFLSNEFRLFPLRFQINVCDALNVNAIGIGTYKRCGNFTGCPIKKNKRSTICNWRIDQSKFPPSIPNGRYMVELEGIFHGVSIGLARIIGRIERPLSIHKK